MANFQECTYQSTEFSCNFRTRCREHCKFANVTSIVCENCNMSQPAEKGEKTSKASYAKTHSLDLRHWLSPPPPSEYYLLPERKRIIFLGNESRNQTCTHTHKVCTLHLSEKREEEETSLAFLPELIDGRKGRLRVGVGRKGGKGDNFLFFPYFFRLVVPKRRRRRRRRKTRKVFLVYFSSVFEMEGDTFNPFLSWDLFTQSSSFPIQSFFVRKSFGVKRINPFLPNAGANG